MKLETANRSFNITVTEVTKQLKITLAISNAVVNSINPCFSVLRVWGPLILGVFVASTQWTND